MVVAIVGRVDCVVNSKVNSVVNSVVNSIQGYQTVYTIILQR